MSTIKALASQTAIYGVGHILSKGLYFIFLVPYLTRRLEDTYSFGVYNDLYAYASILIVFFSFRMDTALFRFGSKVGSLQRAFSTALIPVLLCVASFLLITNLWAQEIANFLLYPDKAFYIKWFSTIIAFDVLVLLPFARLRLENKAIKFVLFKLANVLLTLAIVFFFLEVMPRDGDGFLRLQLEDVEYVFMANMIASCLIFIGLSPMLFDFRWADVDKGQMKNMVFYCAPLLVVGLANSINQFLAVPIQKYFLGSDTVDNLSQAGIYAGPQKITALVSLMTVAFNYAAEPFFFKYAANQDKRDAYGKIALAFIVVMSIALVGIVCYFDILKYIIDVGKYEEGFKIVPILLYAYLFLGLYYNVSIWYKLADKTIYGAIISLLGVTVTLVISILFLPKIGFIASAWAALACYSLMCLAAYLAGQRHYPISYPLGNLFFVILLSLIFLSGAWYLNGLDYSTLTTLGLNSLIFFTYLSILYWRYRYLLRQ